MQIIIAWLISMQRQARQQKMMEISKVCGMIIARRSVFHGDRQQSRRNTPLLVSGLIGYREIMYSYHNKDRDERVYI